MTTTGGSSLTDRFRGSARVRTPLHPLEKAVLVLTCLHLAFLAWALGGMRAWAQEWSLVLAAVTFVTALIPRVYKGEYAIAIPGPKAEGRKLKAEDGTGNQGPDPQLSTFSSQVSYSPWRRLLRFPVFWLGALLLGYIALQGMNPSWVWERNETSWWLRRVTDTAWLPTSVDTPYERFNLWRQFDIYASAWLTVCAVWIGFTRRRSLELLLIFLVVNAVLLAGAGFAQRLFSPYTIVGVMKSPTGIGHFATFIYHNHAGAYFALLVGTAAALAAWVYHEGERTLKKSTPAGLYAVGAIFLAGTVFFTLSRGASLTLALFTLAFGVWFWLRQKFVPTAGTGRGVTIAVVIVFLGVLGYTARNVDISALTGKFDRLIKQQTKEESTRGRILAHESARRMLADHWVRGVGAGGFRYLFPGYISKHPEVYAGGRLFWEHAHNDWLQIPIELGAAGTLLLVIGMGYWVVAFFRRRRSDPITNTPYLVSAAALPPQWHSLALPVALGCGQTLLHAWFDFPFQCPAILVTWLVLLTVSLRWLDFEAA